MKIERKDRAKYKARFEAKFCHGRRDRCWPWLGATFQDGYGQFWIAPKLARAHRISYLIFKGLIPKGKYVLHSCDNPICVNPHHLFLGTHDSNMEDCRKKGRMAKGEQNGRAVLTQQSIIQIFELQEKGWGCYKLARKFRVSHMAIRSVLLGITWKHVPGRNSQ
jgi:hypothetical protein